MSAPCGTPPKELQVKTGSEASIYDPTGLNDRVHKLHNSLGEGSGWSMTCILLWRLRGDQNERR